jgi:pimeloyl-ACP methyl ester carboxylesterase
MSKKQSNKSAATKIPRAIIIYAKFLQFISPSLATKFASRLFMTPIKHKIPKRELEMDQNTKQETILIPKINKSVMVYHYGDNPKKILLVHGWSGRGTQLVKFAEEILKLGYSTISFDAPAHGKSATKTTLMPEFIASILELEKLHGPFDYAIGHSLGGMSLLNAVKQGLGIKKLVVIGSGDIIDDITKIFVKQLELKPSISEKMRVYYEKKFNVLLNDFSAHLAAKHVTIPTLVIHDENDIEVPVSCGKNIHQHLPNGELLITKRLGHRKILGESTVIKKTIDFLFE